MVSLDLEASSLGSSTLGGGSSSHATLELQIRTHGEFSCCAQQVLYLPGSLHCCCMHAFGASPNPASLLPH